MGVLFSATIPLFIYFIIEHFFSFKTAVVLTIIYGIFEFLFFYIKDKRVDKLILVSTILVVLMGGTSFLFESEALFKLNPAILQLMAVAFLSFFWITKKSLFSLIKDRIPKDRQLKVTPEMELFFNKLTRDLSIMLFFHSGLIIYSAYFLSTSAWTFISGVLPYILMILLFFIEVLISRKKENSKNYERGSIRKRL